MYGEIDIQVKLNGCPIGKTGRKDKMNITNAQMKAILDMYTAVKRAENSTIPMMDLSNQQIIKRFERVLNNLLLERINENNANNELFIQARKDITSWKMTIK